MSELSDLAQVRGTTLAAAANRAGLSPRLVQRVADGRQPLPLEAVSALAYGLGVDPSEVKTRVPLTTTHGMVGTWLEGVELAQAYNPLPPRFDEPLDALALRVPPPVTAPTFANPPGIWIGAENINGTDDGVLLFDRGSSQLVAVRPFSAAANAPAVAAADGRGFLWFGCSAGSMALERVETARRAVVHEVTGGAAYTGIVLEPGSGALWVARGTANAIGIVDLITGAQVVAVPLGGGFEPQRGCAFGGRAYFAAHTGSVGRVFSLGLDPLAAIVSTGTAMAASLSSVTTDGTYLYAADNIGVWRIPIATMVCPATRWFAVTTDNPTWTATDDVFYFGGSVFLVGRTATERIVRIDAATATQTELRNLGAVGPARIVADGVTIWVVDAGAGVVRRMNPTILATDVVTLTMPPGATPRSAVITP